MRRVAGFMGLHRFVGNRDLLLEIHETYTNATLPIIVLQEFTGLLEHICMAAIQDSGSPSVDASVFRSIVCLPQGAHKQYT